MTLTAPAPARGPGPPGPPPAARPRSRWRQWLADRPAWPVTALLGGYLVWWALGLADISVIVMAIPMALRMRSWHRSGRKITVPPAFGLWLLFLICAVAGILTLGLVGIYTVLGGLGGVVDARFQFTSPLAYVLPKGMQANSLVQAALYPGFSQVTNVLGVTEGRPKAPFEYTNTWGDCLTILLPWLLVAWWSYGGRRQRKLAIGVAVLALI